MPTQVPTQPTIAATRLRLIRLPPIQAFVGYEWLNSGLSKILRGGFPSGLAADLHDRVKGAPGWHRNFVDGSIIPQSAVFGYLIEIGELLVGVALIAVALAWLTRWERLPDTGRLAVLATSIVAALGAIFTAVNFHLANGGSHPWLLLRSGFDASVDLDSLLPAFQLVLIGVSVATWRTIRGLQPLTSQTSALASRVRARFGGQQIHKGV